MATQSAVAATSVPQGSQSTTGSASIVPQGGLWDSARHFFSLTAPKIGKGKIASYSSNEYKF